jgi:uncharacterized protein (TIGR02270 family)
MVTFMGISHRTFLSRLYEEYLEEASFLFGQRRTLYKNPEITWKKIAEFEERLEAHIDGLVVGDKMALEVCARRAAEGDFGELYAATCVFCRQDQRDRLLALLDQLDPADTEKAGAIADALKYELPDAWALDFLTLLASGDPKLAPILARAFGYRRFQCGPQLVRAMKRCTATALPEIVWALGRIAYRTASGPLLDFLTSEDEPLRSVAAIALARIGESATADSCLSQARSKTWPLVPLGLFGGRSAVDVLMQHAEKDVGTDCLTALGLLGDPVIVPLLIGKLTEPKSAVSAAIALRCLTGAGLSETVFVPDEINEDELFEAEREQLKQGKPLGRGDGRPFGSTVTRLSQNPKEWDRWWEANACRFTSGVRYRNGGLFSPGRLIEMLTDECTPHQLRGYCSEELATRYENDFGIETDMPVGRQLTKLGEAGIWSQTGSTRFQEGEWYFAGRRCA